MNETLGFPPPPRLKVALPHRNRIDVWGRAHSGFQVPTIAVSTARNVDKRGRCERDLGLFLLNYFAHRYYDPNAVHLEIVRSLQDAILSTSLTPIKQAIAAPRSIGKTTIIEGAIIWAMLYGHKKFIAFISSSGPKAEKRILSVKNEFLSNDVIAEDFPDVILRLKALHNGDSHRAPPEFPWTGECIRLPNGSWMRAVGIDGGLPGMDQMGVRPDLVIADDVETVSSIESETETKTIDRRLRLEMLRLHDINKPGAAYFYICTVRGRDCISDRLTSRTKSPEWRGLRFKALLKEPDDPAGLWEEFKTRCRWSDDVAGEAELEWNKLDATDKTSYESQGFTADQFSKLYPGHRMALRFYIANQTAMDAGAELLDAKRLPLHMLYQIRAEEKGEETFLCELQNDPPDENADNMDRRKWTPANILSHATDYPPLTLPIDCPAELVTMGADVHAAVIYYVFRAWTMNGTSWGIEQGISEIHLSSGADDVERQRSITSALRRLWDVSQEGFKCGQNVLGLRIGFVDEGWETDIVRAMCRETGYIWRAVKGVASLQRPRFAKMHTNPTSIDLGVDHFKHDLARLLSRTRSKSGEESGYWHLHRSPTHSYSHHMCSEEWCPKKNKHGTDVQEFHWETLNRNNHWWDCENYATAAAYAAGVRFTPDTVALPKRESNEPSPIAAKAEGWKIGR